MKKNIILILFVLTAGVLSAQNKFAVGGDIAVAGPGVDFSYYNNHFTAGAGVTASVLSRMIFNDPGLLPEVLTKFEAGYVTTKNADICRFAYGGSIINAFYTDNVKNFIGLYGRVFKNFNKIELSLNTALPLYELDFYKDDFAHSPAFASGYAVFLLTTSISVKYCF